MGIKTKVVLDKLIEDYTKQVAYYEKMGKELESTNPMISIRQAIKEIEMEDGLWAGINALEQTTILIDFATHVNDTIVKSNYIEPPKKIEKKIEGKSTIIYTDGGCRGNGKEESIGSWGANIYLDGVMNDKYIKVGGATGTTTNNIMELKAVIEGLQYVVDNELTGSPVDVHADSAYVLNGISGKNPWVVGWQKNAKDGIWKNSKKNPVANQELWEQLIELTKQIPNINWVKVKGHSDDVFNERVDLYVNELMDEYKN